MKNIMLINAKHSEEKRVAIVEDGLLQELEVEYSGKKQTKGNIYKGVITKIQPSIHALFIDFGEGKNGFLPFTEVHPSCYGRDTHIEGESKGAKPKIENIMKPGQELTVQVVKEERDHKGAYLTTYISIAGRYLVLMPGSKKGGVSRKIEDEKEREKLKEIVSQFKLPEDQRVIIRTAGMGKSKIDLKRDVNNLLKMWEIIKKKAKEDELKERWASSAPGKFEHRNLGFYKVEDLPAFLEQHGQTMVPSGAATWFVEIDARTSAHVVEKSSLCSAKFSCAIESVPELL